MMNVEEMPINKKMLCIAREKMIKRLFTSDLADKFSLLSVPYSEEFAKSGSWDKLRNSSLEVEYTDISQKDIEDICEEFDESYRIVNENETIRLSVNYLIDRYRVLLKVTFIPVKSIENSEESTVRLTLIGEETSIRCSRSDDKLVSEVVEVLDKLEFIKDVECYDNIYNTLNAESLDGRHIKAVMEEKLAYYDMDEKKKRFATVSSYDNYPLMRKKWNRYLKNTGKKSPEWNNVIDSFTAFLDPILNAIENDEVFFGDWMPELQRYLD